MNNYSNREPDLCQLMALRSDRARGVKECDVLRREVRHHTDGATMDSERSYSEWRPHHIKAIRNS